MVTKWTSNISKVVSGCGEVCGAEDAERKHEVAHRETGHLNTLHRERQLKVAIINEE